MGWIADAIARGIINGLTGQHVSRSSSSQHAPSCRYGTPHCADCGRCLTKYVNRLDFNQPGPLYCFVCFRKHIGLPNKRRSA